MLTQILTNSLTRVDEVEVNEITATGEKSKVTPAIFPTYGAGGQLHIGV